MINDDELKFQRIKFEQAQGEIKTSSKIQSGKLGPRHFNIGTQNQKIDVAQEALVNLGNLWPQNPIEPQNPEIIDGYFSL